MGTTYVLRAALAFLILASGGLAWGPSKLLRGSSSADAKVQVSTRQKFYRKHYKQ
jgi:hypothetical protein